MTDSGPFVHAWTREKSNKEYTGGKARVGGFDGNGVDPFIWSRESGNNRLCGECIWGEHSII